MASWLPLTARQAEAGPLGTVLILGVTGISGYLAAQNAWLLGAASIASQIPAYIKLIADGSVQVPFRTFPLSEAGTAWTASTDSGPRVVLVPD